MRESTALVPGLLGYLLWCQPHSTVQGPLVPSCVLSGRKQDGRTADKVPVPLGSLGAVKWHLPFLGGWAPIYCC